MNNTVRRMKNIVTVSLESLTSSPREVTRQLSERLRNRLKGAGVDCEPSFQSFKPGGTAFRAGPPDRCFFVTVCWEPDDSFRTEVTIISEPRVGFWTHVFRFRGHTIRRRNWSWFEPLLKNAVEAEFSGCALKWMTVDEFIGEGPSAQGEMH